MKYYTLLIALLVACLNTTYAEPSQLDKYKQNYVEQLIPLLKERMGTELEMESEADANEHVSTIAKRMAECQLITIAVYPQKYQDASIIPVANGEDIRKATSNVNAMIETDIKNGELSKNDLKTITETATEKYKTCLN